LLFIESTYAYFEKLTKLISANASFECRFVEAEDLSIARFAQLLIEDTALNANSRYFKIQAGSEVYVTGRAKHPNPYVITTTVDPGEGAPLIDGHEIAVYEAEEQDDLYVLPTV
jgi:hypothetical protein